MSRRAALTVCLVFTGLLAACEEQLPEAPDCVLGVEQLPPQQIRLLTRREYRNTLQQVLPALWEAAPSDSGGGGGAACSDDTECDLTRASCVDQLCQPDPCGRVTFTLADEGWGAVHLAGSVNQWAPTVDEGAWPLRFDESRGLWWLKADLDDGRHSYKFVVDGDWIADPADPLTEDDGFGGANSVLELDCSAGEPGDEDPGDPAEPAEDDSPFDPVANWPEESRPPHFPFDNNAAAGVVTAVHVEHQLRAAEAVSARALARLPLLLPCAEGATSGPPAALADCAAGWLDDIGPALLRRPLSDEERSRYLAAYQAQANAADGLSVLLQILLTTPGFLYRMEVGEAQADGRFALDGLELASALSYFLWGGPPDQELLTAAVDGTLESPEGLRRQAGRLLGDERARDTVEHFAAQWLGVERVLTFDKSPTLFPELDAQLRLSMLDETSAFVSGVVFDGDGALDTLLSAPFSHLDPVMADFYGVAPGPEAALPPERAGVLGHASVLAANAHSDQTSPVRRGLFVRERLLCQDLGTPPADAGGVPVPDPEATTRERFAQHSEDPACHLCHRYIDPVGFGFERFDALGRYREQENGQTIDPSGAVEDIEEIGMGEGVVEFDTLPELGAALAASQSAHDCFSRQWYRYATGQLASRQENCAVDHLAHGFLLSGGDIPELLLSIASSDFFRYRRPAEEGGQP